MTSQPTQGPGWPPLLMAVWGVVAIAAGPVILVAELAHGFGSLGSTNAHPWAAPLATLTALASFVAGLAVFAIRGPWWTALLVASPALFRFLMYSGEQWAAFALLVTPLLAPLGVVLAVTLRPDGEDADDEADDDEAIEEAG